MKKVYLSYHDIHTDSVKFAKIIEKKIKPKKIIISSQAGLIPGNIIANYLSIKEIEYLNSLKKHNLEKNKSNNKLLIIDSLYSDGRIAASIKKSEPNSTIVSLYIKSSSKNKVDLSLYNFNKNELVIFPWENESL
jgi:hypoxanthine phosphoribosyltransferase|tara:strand:+ start:228 stop:632 length:405 start_codon:yes stop_codon:yes gene_type:complete